MKVLFLDIVHPILEERLLKMGFDCEHDYSSSRDDILKKINAYDALVIRSRFPIDKEFIEQSAHLKFIARSGAGLDNINCKEAKRKNIALISAPEGNRQAVGEHSLGMILSLFNRLSIADKEIRFGKWRRERNRGVELSGKTIGIIGYGHMGTSFAKCLQGFDCEILAYDKYKKNYADESACASSLEEIQEKADVISIHIPYSQSTHHYFNTDFIDKMKHPFYIINTSRGKVVDTSDLVKGLKSKKILGACLDVLEYEKSSFANMFDQNMPPASKYLVSSENVLLSPHVAGWTIESYEKLSSVLADKIQGEFGS